MSLRPREIIAWLSTNMISPAFSSSKSLVTAMPAAPAPTITILLFCRVFLTTFMAFIIAARATMAVPCWSSCITGISNSSISRFSISKQRGAEISSKFMPPKIGAICLTAATISSTSCVSKIMGKASTLANALNNWHLPSITGMAPSGPILPRPSTAEPSETTATAFLLMVKLRTWSLCPARYEATAPTPGV